jgi:hypothetical protein
MAQDDLVGNMNMEWIIGYLQEQGLVKNINEAALEKCLDMSSRIFV